MLSEKGSLKETPAMKLLLTVFEQDLTGILYLKNDDVLKVLYFQRGKLTWAISNSSDDKLENIFIARKQVSPELLTKIKREAHVSESIGKLLVGQGLITLEELIDSTRTQLNRIITSVLKWKTGGFQFVKDMPPERLLSLDLQVTDFIVKFILEEVDLSDIWKKIGSLQVEFIKNPDESKIAKYKLSENQKKLLDNFTGESKLESILSRYTGGHRESLLKIIFFFLMSELLIKKEFDLTDSSAFDEENGFDYFGSESTPPPREKTVSSNQGGDAKSQEYVFDMGASPAEEEEEEEISSHEVSPQYGPPADLTREEIKAYQRAAAPRNTLFAAEMEPEGGGKRTKMMTLAMVILIPIVLGFIFLYLAGVFHDKALSELPTAKNDKDIITIEEKNNNALKTDTAKNGEAAKAKSTDAGQEKEQSVETQKPKEGAEQTVAKKDPPKEETKPPVKETKKDEPKKTEKNKFTPGKSAMSYFREGNMTVAADVWKRELKRTKIQYSVLLELDCVKESVWGAYSKINDKSKFFLLNKRSGRRNCYLVMYGKYRTYSEAVEGIKKVPKYFWGQANPPEVIGLDKYL